MAIITLLTDFGARDGFVGVLKGVILALNPHAQIVDLAHEISPGDIAAGAFVLAASYAYFPPETIHVVVIDPGVGTTRKPLCVRTKTQFFLAPDNGVLQWIYAANPDAVVVELTNAQYFLSPLSNTFHGRDIFAPVAAHLSLGTPQTGLGKPLLEFNRGVLPPLRQQKNMISGVIIYIDRFGNLISNIASQYLQPKNIEKLVLPRHTISRLSCSYQNVENGPMALIGSHGFLEIALNGKKANEVLEYGIGTEIDVCLKE